MLIETLAKEQLELNQACKSLYVYLHLSYFNEIHSYS